MCDMRIRHSLGLWGVILLTVVMLVSFLSCKSGVMRPETSSKVKTHTIRITLFPEKHEFKARDHMLLDNQGSAIMLSLNENFEILSVKVNGVEATFQFGEIPELSESARLEDDNVAAEESLAGGLRISVPSPGKHKVEIEYRGTVYDKPDSSQFTREYVANQTTGIINEEGSFLSPETVWYPRGSEEMSRFEVITITPEGYETITQGARIKHEAVSGMVHTHWKNENPADVLYLQAGPYQIQEDEVEGIKIFTYFFPGGEEVAALYLEKSKQYLSMYNRLLGKYPHPKFAVVENFFETGYGMPSWTLLGKTVVRLPWIPDTSLPHEICHNWWGNGVFVDYSFGNWCEGLTVYCADYLLKKKVTAQGGVDYRRQINRDYASYVRQRNDFPLREFKVRHDPATRAVGYGKSMMVFHILQRKVGEEKFFESLRQLVSEFLFKKASWKDVLGVFEASCGIMLDEFFAQWVERAGAPVLKLQDVTVSENDSGYSVGFKIIQEGSPYALDIPVMITTAGEDFQGNFMFDSVQKEVSLQVKSKPLRMEVDPAHELFRRLYPEEIPPSIAKVFGSEKQIIVLPRLEGEEKLNQYRAAADLINKTKTASIKFDDEVDPKELEAVSIIVLGVPSEGTGIRGLLHEAKRDPPWDEKLTGAEDAATVLVYDHPQNGQHGIMFIEAQSRAEILSIARKLPHYGKYSYLLFLGSQNIAKGIWEVESSPLIHVFE